MMEKILIIKLSALGDFIQALGLMRAIRHHHKQAHITLLTTKSFKNIAAESGYIDEIIIDKRPKFYDLKGWLDIKNTLNKAHFSRIYDLQNNERSCNYFKLFKKPKPEWVGIAKGASHRNTDPQRTKGHAFDGHKQTLKLAGIDNIEIDNLAWMRSDISHLNLPEKYAMLIPGCAPSRPEKRWSAHNYAALAAKLNNRNITPIIIGTKDEAEARDIIVKHCPQALDLLDKTSIKDIVSIAHNALYAIGNDTGPMHIIGATGCPSLVLFSNASNPIKHAPKGHKVKVIQKENLNDLSLDKVLDTLDL